MKLLRVLHIFTLALMLAPSAVSGQATKQDTAASARGDTARPGSAGRQTTPPPTATDTAKQAIVARPGEADYPRVSVWQILLSILVFGALGGLVAELMNRDGRLIRYRLSERQVVMGWTSWVIVGAAGALAALALNPPGESWLRLWGAAVLGGVGARALFLSAANGKRAAIATEQREAADSQVRQVKHAAASQLQALGAMAGATRGSGGSERASPGLESGVVEAPDPIRLQMKAALEQLRSFGASADTKERMRGILQDVFNRSDVEPGTMKDFGMKDPERDQIVYKTNAEFTGLIREFLAEDVTTKDTLNSLAGDVEALRST